MRDKGKPQVVVDKDIISDTLRSLENLIREVDTDTTAQPAAEAATAPPPAEPGPAPSADANASEVEPTAKASAGTEGDAPAATTTIDYEPLPAPDETQPTVPTTTGIEVTENDGIPVLSDVAELPAASPGGDQQELSFAEPPRRRGSPPLDCEHIADQVLAYLNERILAETGEQFDAETGSRLRDTLVVLIGDWHAHRTGENNV